MKELDFLKIITDVLDDNSLLGDDCAYLSDLDIFITQDTLVEDVHFSLYTTSPYLLGRKSVAVNLSDIASSLSMPKYITVSVSLPASIENSFVSEFYRGVNEICSEYGVKVAGGDITGADKVMISVCAIGKKKINYISSRSFAKKGDIVAVVGKHGSSAAGLYALSNFLYADEELINSHIYPKPCLNQSYKLSKIIDENIVVMDSSDGLIDSLYKIASASRHSLEIDINKVPVSEKLIEFSSQNNLDYKDFVKWGGEDYGLIICLPDKLYSLLNPDEFVAVGKVLNKDISPCVVVKDGSRTENITENVFFEKSYNHFS